MTSRLCPLILSLAAAGLAVSCTREGPAPQAETDELLSRYRGPSARPAAETDPVLEKIASLVAAKPSPEQPPQTEPSPAPPTQPAEEKWLVGPSDELDILVAGQAEFSGRVTVRDDGTLELPTTGDLVHVAGKSCEEVASAVADAISPKYLKRRPTVSVTLARSPRLVYHVFGAVRRPGRYDMPRGGLTVLDAVILASGPGGFEPVAGARYDRVYVIGPSGEQRIVDIASAMRGSASRYERVPPGGMVLVPASSGEWEESEIRKRLRSGGLPRGTDG